LDHGRYDFIPDAIHRQFLWMKKGHMEEQLRMFPDAEASHNISTLIASKLDTRIYQKALYHKANNYFIQNKNESAQKVINQWSDIQLANRARFPQFRSLLIGT